VNSINRILHRLHSHLSSAENGGDIADELPLFYRLQELIAMAKSDPSILADFDPDGLDRAYIDQGFVFCQYDENWQSKERHADCDCDDEVNSSGE
jgi:hypothetical protein